MKTPEIGNRKRNLKLRKSEIGNWKRERGRNEKRKSKKLKTKSEIEKIRNRKSEKRERGRNDKRKSKMGGDSFQGKTYLLLQFSHCGRLQAESRGERKRESRGERKKETLGERRLLI